MLTTGSWHGLLSFLVRQELLLQRSRCSQCWVFWNANLQILKHDCEWKIWGEQTKTQFYLPILHNDPSATGPPEVVGGKNRSLDISGFPVEVTDLPVLRWVGGYQNRELCGLVTWPGGWQPQIPLCTNHRGRCVESLGSWSARISVTWFLQAQTAGRCLEAKASHWTHQG